jgi:hypothetical protein
MHYQSPVNQLSCSDHNGTNCMEWRYIGLTVDQVQELIEKCPISCNIACGSLDRFSIDVTFRVAQASTFLGPDTAQRMKDVGIDYLADFIQSRISDDSQIYVSEAELLSQQIIIGSVHNRMRRGLSRDVERLLSEYKQTVDLLVNVSFRGLSINLEEITLKGLIVDGIQSAGYTNALQRSGDPELEHVVVSLTTSNATSPSIAEGGSEKGVSPGGIAASVLVTLSVLGAAGVLLFMHIKRQQEKRSWAFKDPSDISAVVSPAESQKSPMGSAFSFESASQVVAGIRDMVTGMSSRNSNSETTSTDSSGFDCTDMTPKVQQYRIEEEVSSKESSVVENAAQVDEEEDVHPYAGVIPPMIVMDYIDSTEDDIAELYKPKIKNIVPTRRLQAPSDLVAALNDHSKPFDSSAFTEILSGHAEQKVEDIHPSTTAVSSRDLLAKGLDAFSVTAQPKSVEFTTDHSKSESSESPNDESASVIDSSTTSVGDQTLHIPPPPPSRSATDVDETGLPLDAAMANATNAENDIVQSAKSMETNVELSMTAPYDDDDDDDKSKTSLLNKFMYVIRKSPEKARRKISPTSYTHLDDSHYRLQAVDESISENESQQLQPLPPPPPPRTTTPPSVTLARAPTNSLPSQHSRTSSKESSVVSLENTYESPLDGVQHIFQAPRKGKLGLVIECNGLSGPCIIQVKDYSPLLGHVQPGDQIISIDGVDTIGMSLTEVTKLLNGMTTSKRSSVVRIVIRRPTETIPSVAPVSSHASLGEGSITGSRIVPWWSLSPAIGIPNDGSKRESSDRISSTNNTGSKLELSDRTSASSVNDSRKEASERKIDRKGDMNKKSTHRSKTQNFSR